MDLSSYFKKQSKKIDEALNQCLPKVSERPSKLHEAMRYAVLGGGKRVRPILALAAAEAVGGDEKKVLPAACAIELIHSYSLVHDDLPCMDDDDLRRGKPTCHKKYGEETALLVGDALLTLAFKILTTTNNQNTLKDLERKLIASRWIAEAVGTKGMVGGQAVDIEFKNKEVDLPTMEYINIHKSGALIAASLKVGAFLAGGNDKKVQACYEYGKAVGLLFQIVDDRLDKEGYARIIGISEVEKEARVLRDRAVHSLKSLRGKENILTEIADFILKRDH